MGQDITAAVAKPFADADHLLLIGRYGGGGGEADVGVSGGGLSAAFPPV
ncbi:hypothetical protein ACFYO2_20370 [Streptomyces sp. NPDC006602]